jgi:putative heme-binding domain-containing protein
VRDATDLLLARLKDADAGVRFQAATALGRVGNPAAVPALIEALTEEDFFTRYAVFTALNRIGRAEPSAWRAIVRGVEHSNPVVRTGALMALRETYDPALVEALAGVAGDAAKPPETRAAVLSLLGPVHRQKPAWKGEWWAYHPVNAPPPAKSVAWAGTEAVQTGLRRSLGDAHPLVRRAGADGLREAGDTGSAPLLRELFRRETDAGVRRSVLAALGALRDREAGGLIRAVLLDPERHVGLLAEAVAAGEQVGGEDVAAGLIGLLKSGPRDRDLLLPTVRALGHLRVTAAVPLLTPLARGEDAEARRAALGALARVGGDAGLTALTALADDPATAIRCDAVAALGDLKSKAALPRLLAAYRDPETRPVALAALTRVPDVLALDAYLDGLSSPSAELREKCRQALGQIRGEGLRPIEAKVEQLRPEVVVQLRQVYQNHAAARRGRLFAVAVQMPGPDEYLDFALKTPGDAARGKALFDDPERMACAKCHKVHGRGGEIGPDLTTVGAQFDRRQLAESILFPSRSIREGYYQVAVATKDGRSVAGLVRAESDESLTLRDAEGKDHHVRKADIEDRSAGRPSLMPEGLQIGLSLDSFADLVAFLQSLK